MTIAQRIKTYRQDNGLSQQEFADLIGVKQPQIAIYEKGKFEPSKTVRASLVKIGFPKDELFPKGDSLYMASEELKDTAEQLILTCKLVSNQPSKLPSEVRIKALKAAIADYEAALAKPECTDKGASA